MERHGHYVDGLAVFRFPDADRPFEIHSYMRIRLKDGRRLIVYSNLGPYGHSANGPWEASSATVINPLNGLSRRNRFASGNHAILDPLGVYLTTGETPPEFDNLLNAPPLNAIRTRGLIVEYFQQLYPEIAEGERSDGFVLWHTVSGIGHNGSGAANDLMAELGQVAGVRQTSDMMIKVGINQIGEPACVEMDRGAHECDIDLAMSFSITPWQYAGGTDAGLINWMFRQGFGAGNQAATPDVRRFRLVFHDDGRQLTFESRDELDEFLGIL